MFDSKTALFHRNTEWRTLVLMLGCYWLYFILNLQPLALPSVLYAMLLIPLLAFHATLQHEALHGHPFVNRRFNDWLMIVPVGLFIPYFRFKDTHLKHHKNARLCDPYDDPESWYQTDERWQSYSSLVKRLFWMNNSLAGRMILGPGIGIFGIVVSDFRAICSGNREFLKIWAVHLLLCGILLTMISLSGMAWVLIYILCCYMSMSLSMVRTFAEHQIHESMRGRSVIIEDRGFFSFLFLNNNLHAVHHAYPSIAWYDLPKIFRNNREKFLRMNYHYHFRSYWQIIWSYALRHKETPIYQLSRPQRPYALKDL